MSTNIEFAPITFESNSDLKVEDTIHVFLFNWSMLKTNSTKILRYIMY